ncbi:MAG TPA: alpha/beta fold hydrolase [Myxococcaceae bacterium]|jgi:hypothetical protein
MTEQPTTLAGVPALAVSKAPPEEAAATRGTVLLFHGFTGSKEVQRTEAFSLARRGYLAITPDAVGHGARRFADFDRRFPPDLADRNYFEVVQQTADELPSLIAELQERRWALPGRLGACGISMGGAVLFGAIASGCAFGAAAAIVASPVWRHRPFSPHERLDRFFPVPLLLQNASADEVVNPAEARALCEALAPRYASAPERLRYFLHSGEGHMFSERGWHRAWGEVEAWFDRFLR